MKIQFNGAEFDSPDGETVAALLRRLGINPLHVAVELNQDVCPRTRHAEVQLREGDCVEVVTLVGGGA